MHVTQRPLQTKRSKYGARARALRGGSIAKGTAWMTYAYGLGLVVQGAYFVLLARLLGAAGLGTFAGALALASAVAPFSGLGSGNLLLMHTARDRQNFRTELGTALVTIAVTGIGLTMVLALLAETALHRTQLSGLIIPLAASEVVFARIVDLSGQCFQAHERYSVTANLSILLSALRLIAIAAFGVVEAHRSASDWSLWYACASAAAAAVGLALVVQRLDGPVFQHFSLRGRTASGIAFSIGTASKTIYADIDKTMLTRLSTSTSAGIYTAAYRVVAMAYAPVLAFLYASNARFFRVGVDGAFAVWRVVRRSWPILVIYSAVIGVVLLAAAPIMPLILGRSFEPSASALRWLAALPIIMASHSLLGDAMMGMGKQGLRSGVQLATAGLNVGLNFWLIPTMSWRGAAIASFISESVLALVLWILLRRLVRLEPVPIASGST